MNLNLDDAQLKDLIGEALLRSLDQAGRDVLIKDAIAHLVTPTKSAYNNTSESPLQMVFHQAVITVTREVIAAQLKENEVIKTAVDSLIMEAVQRVFVDQREKTIEKVTNSIVEALKIDKSSY